ncbi:hypothetical protein OGAPHI_001895 [Ogataea philodendri]|uniref:Uncharacterized protein n=1 Tax=Ogataea philodendri TaxID=1378263 RepID=A0A9P8PAF7_9ASCO|nr:uncharacterized protein OGAPHI_001895 [Ogataea philodendri]KAH3668141.1 hypothetical protein OGAPHI_001895 [Ogataea philodendri]
MGSSTSPRDGTTGTSNDTCGTENVLAVSEYELEPHISSLYPSSKEGPISYCKDPIGEPRRESTRSAKLVLEPRAEAP